MGLGQSAGVLKATANTRWPTERYSDVGWVERQRNPTLDNRYVDPVLGFTVSLFQTVLLKNTAAIVIDRYLL